MKNRGHVYMARLLYDELVKNEGSLIIRTVPDENGHFEEQEYQVPEQIYRAIKSNRGCFLAGAVGPDFFPDMLTGQMLIHPQNSGKWLDMMFRELQTISPQSQEYGKALAFYLGWMMHYCGDMYGHHFVNLYAYGWFPSIMEMAEDAKEIFLSDKAMAVVDYISKKLSAESVAELSTDSGETSFQKLILGDPEFISGLEQYLKELEKDDTPMDRILELLGDVLRLFRLINSAMNIIRHLTIEAFMDQIILENLTARGLCIDEYFDLEIPNEFLRRCFTTPADYKRMEELSGGEVNDLNPLGKFIEHYEQEHQKNLRDNPSTRALEDLQLRAIYLDRWVAFWKILVENDLKYGKVIPEGYSWDMAEEFSELFAAYMFEDEDTVREVEGYTKAVDALIGFFKPLGKGLEFIGVNLEDLFMAILDILLLDDLKKLAEPVMAVIAKALLQTGCINMNTVHAKLVEDMDYGPFENVIGSTVSGIEIPYEDLKYCVPEEMSFDLAKAVISTAFSSPGLLLDCKPLFNVEGLQAKLKEEWARLGVEGTDCFNIGCPMMENALQMGKLCLLGSESLNDLFQSEVADVRPFHSADVQWTLSEVMVELVPENGKFKNSDYVISLKICSAAGTVQDKVAVWDSRKGHPKGNIKQEFRLSNPIPVRNMGRCSITIEANAANIQKERIRCNLYDRMTGQLLGFAHLLVSGSGTVTVELLPLDREQITEHLTDLMENALRVNSLSKLQVTVETGNDGTDANVKFYVIDKNGKTLRGPIKLDKSCYNDFEQKDCDTYEISFDTISDIRTVRGFAINKEDNGGSWAVKRIQVTVADGTIADGVTIADQAYNNKKIGSAFEYFDLDWDAVKAPEVPLDNQMITKLVVVIHTKDELWAGTDDNVYLEIFCGGKAVRKVELDSNRNDFERDRMDTYCVNIADKNGVGLRASDIQSFRISKETPTARMNDDWVVDNVWIRTYDGGIELARFKGDQNEDSAHTFNEENNALTISSLSI